ncbi:unnamed protein product [Aureobasidium vineae]|uniref:Apple domain-containing protein n=1 Tax=Aureobasidium vineae TaxID=2773715 RepID=A0A9N8JAA8_9PEZI|nr:unnamed protein product [Aureobasidium vineae]
MRTAFSTIAAASLAALAGAQNTTIDVDAISVAVPTSVFVLPVVYVTAEGAPTLTATTLASTATPSSDPSATAVFDSSADVTSAISVASEIAAATATPAAVKRDGSCVQQPLVNIGHVTVPDTAAAFAGDLWYGVQALAAILPAGYVQTFSNLTASNSADQYVGFTLMNSYDVAGCGQKCTAMDGCNSFNIYYERDPQYDPSVAGCANPPSTVNVKCVFWGGAVTADNANNFGQMRDGFNVVVAGSNGYIAGSYAAKLLAKATATSSSPAAASATDVAGNIYTLYYSSDSTQGSYSNAQASNSYADCMTACDADSQCNAFTYVGGANGVGSGTCWLKSQLGNPSSSGNNVLSGVRSGKAVSSSSSSVVSTTSSSSSSSSVLKTSSSASVTSSSSSSSSVVSTTMSSSSSSTVASSTKTSSSSSSSATTMSTITKSASSSTSSSASSTSASKTSSTTAAATTSAASSSSQQSCSFWNPFCWF